MPRIRILLLTVLVVILPSGAFGAPIEVEILPAAPSVSDPVSLKTTLEWPTSGYEVTGSSVTFLSAYELQIDITVTYPAPGELVLAVITYGARSADLGLLPAGTYSYTVIETGLQRPTNLPVGGGSLSGSFTVVPEPSPLTLALTAMLGLVGLATWRQIHSNPYRQHSHRRLEVEDL